jgi:hypothetical protein
MPPTDNIHDMFQNMIVPFASRLPSVCIAIPHRLPAIFEVVRGRRIYRFSVNFLRFSGFFERSAA